MSAYSASQISQYLSFIGLPESFASLDKHDLKSLTKLYVHQIVAIPYENLSLHYNPDHYVSLDPQYLFDKMVTRGRWRGGFCLETQIFFWHILQGLGFSSYMAGVRVRLRKDNIPFGAFIGFRHIVNIVTLADGSKWSCDPGFGGDGPTLPLKLEDGYTIHNLGTQEVRLVLDYLPEQTSRLPEQRLWIYQYRNSLSKPWHSYYAFSEWEFLPTDFDCINYEVCNNPTCFQRSQMFINRFLRRPGEERIYGKVMLADNLVKINTTGKTTTARVLESEEDRVAALKEYFNMTLTEAEIAGILDWPTQLAAKAHANGYTPAVS